MTETPDQKAHPTRVNKILRASNGHKQLNFETRIYQLESVSISHDVMFRSLFKPNVLIADRTSTYPAGYKHTKTRKPEFQIFSAPRK
jgi:hypothetical protein